MKKTLIIIALLALPSIMQAYCQLPSSTATYTVYSRRSHVGEIVQKISFEKRHYQVDTSTKIGFFLLRDTLQQSSEGLFGKGLIQPKNYKFWDVKHNFNNIINFYPKKKLVRGVYKKNVFRKAEDRWPLYDPLSYQLALRCALMSKDKTNNTFRVYDRNTMHTYEFKIIHRNKKIQTPIGDLLTYEVRGIINPGNQFVLLWFARHRHMALVQSSILKYGKSSAFTIIKSLQ